MIWGLLKLGPSAVFEPSTETPLPCKGHQPVVLVAGSAQAKLRTHTQTNTYMHTYVSLQYYYRISGEVIILLLLQHGLNSRQIWPELVLLHFCSIGSSLNPALATWMGDTKRSCTHSCHTHQMSLRSICCHAASDGYHGVIWKLRELNGSLERPELETDKWGRLEPRLSHRYSHAPSTWNWSSVALLFSQIHKPHTSSARKACDTTSRVAVPKTISK